MGSQLATILVRATAPSSPSGDVIWRNAELENLEFVGIAPTTGTLEELISFRGPSSAGETLARLVPGQENTETLVTSSHPSVRTGAAQNRLVIRDQLNVLVNDPVTAVTEAAKDELSVRDRLRSEVTSGTDAAASYKAAAEILTRGRVEEIRWLHQAAPNLLAGALASDDRSADRLTSLDSELFTEIAVEILSSGEHLIGRSVARWALQPGELQEALLSEAVKNPSHLRKRLTGPAQHLLQQAGVLRKVGALEPRKIHVRLEDMALALEPAEIAAMYFSTAEKVSPQFALEVLDNAPVTLLINHLIGQTARRPEAGEVVRLLNASSAERRNEISDALEAVVSKAEHSTDLGNPLEGLPWGGELSLALKRVRVYALREDEATSLLQEIEKVLTGDELAWEYLIALSEDWEGALIELVASAARMEGLATTA